MKVFLPAALFAPLALAHALDTRQIEPALARIITNCTEPNMAALTFDDGPYIYESRLVDILDELHVKATFFINGNNSAFECIFNDSAIASIKKAFHCKEFLLDVTTNLMTLVAGHQMSSHTWRHLNLTTLTADEINSEMNRTETALRKILGIVPAFMRPPYGSYNDLVRQVSASRNQSLVIWNLDSQDWAGASLDTIEGEYNTSIAIKPKQSILPLHHEWVNQTVEEVVPWVVPRLRKAGYRFVTIAECAGAKSAYQHVGLASKKDDTWVCD